MLLFLEKVSNVNFGLCRNKARWVYLLVCLDQMLHLCHSKETHKSGLRLQVCVCVCVYVGMSDRPGLVNALPLRVCFWLERLIRDIRKVKRGRC